MDKEWQEDYDYLVHHLKQWMVWPREIGIEAVIQVKQAYQIKYGQEALRKVVAEVAEEMISENLGRLYDGHLAYL